MTEIPVNRDRDVRTIKSPKSDRRGTSPVRAGDLAFAGCEQATDKCDRSQFRPGVDLRKKALWLCYLARIPLSPALFKLPLLRRFDGTRP